MSIKRILSIATFVLAAAATSSAFAHAKLVLSDPKADSTLDSAPKQVRIKFNEAIEPSFSKIKLTGPQDKEIPVTATTVDKADPTAMIAPLPALSSGEYHIQWSTMTHDGHKAKGEVAFKVK
jgi:methionine-rich copper-binding protein CopC